MSPGRNPDVIHGVDPGMTSIPFRRILRVEVRKVVDTRSGWWLLAVVGLVSLVGLVWRWTHLRGAVAVNDSYQDATGTAAILLLPVLGVLSTTAEWSRRTALTTFTLVPRRGRVLAAKLLAALSIIAGSVLLTAGLAAVGVVGAVLFGGQRADWGDPVRSVPGMVLIGVLNGVVGAAFGLLLGQTAAAVALYYLAPTVWAAVGTHLFGEAARWFNLFGSFHYLASFHLGGQVGPILTSVTVWVVLPSAVGVVAALRRPVS